MKLYKRPNSPFWQLRYSLRGKQFRESTETADESQAKEFMEHRRNEIGADRLNLKKFIGPSTERVKMERLFADLERHYRLRQIKSLRATLSHLKITQQAFGGYLARQVDSQVVERWMQAQLNDGIAPSTINRRVAQLSRALQLGWSKGLVPAPPRFMKLSELGRERRGFFEKADAEAVIEHLPAYLKDFARFAWLCGWRKGEISSLKWSDVDLNGKMIRLRPENSKNSRGRILPLRGELDTIIQRRNDSRAIGSSGTAILSEYVFHRDGLKIGDTRKAWATACRAANCPGRLFHDFRRTAARNLRLSGVPENVAMTITGHKTRSVFDRYNIVSQDDTARALDDMQSHLKGQEVGKKVVTFKAP